MPFDQFTIEQIAGDLLPNATLSQRVATGFHRNTMLNEEGGIDPLEFRFYAMTDRVATTGTVWLGLTIGCAQCHTHKFDPISHTDYYRLFAFLNNADEPEMPVPTREEIKKRAEIETKIAELKAVQARKAESPEMVEGFASWQTRQRRSATAWSIVRAAKMDGGLTNLTLLDDGSVFASGDMTKRDVYRLMLENLPASVTAIRLEAMPDERLPARGPGRTFYEGPKGEFFLSEMTLTIDGRPAKFALATEGGAENGGAAKFVIDGNPLTGMGAGGKVGKPRQAVFVLEKPLDAKTATLELVFEKYYASSLGRFRISATTARHKAVALDIPGDVEDALALDPDKRSPAQRAALLQYWLETAPEFKGGRDEIEELRRKAPKPSTTLVMRERPASHPRATFRHHRGEFLQPKEEVEPGVPAWLPSLPSGAAANRLRFARWLVSPENPLTARVTVNRYWQAFFGRGIVRTLGDFGYQGEAPTNQELLDWLAKEFMARGWSVKKLHKLIVMSATYRQASRLTPELLVKDADNKYLARGPRVRLDAEQIRDSALQAAGLLSSKMFGPSVFPPQPAGVTTEGTYGGLNWKVSQGEDRFRRGLYTFSKRTAPYAMANTFDAPSGEVCLARREVTNSALQALTMLNDVVLLEAARGIARVRWLMTTRRRTSSPISSSVAWYAHQVGRNRLQIVKFYEAQRARFAAEPKRADAVAGAGPGNVAERAAWTATARAILNLDEFITKE